MAELTAEDYIHLVYRQLLGRPADPDGLAHFAQRLRAGERLETFIDAIADSEEYRAKSRVAKPVLDFVSRQTQPVTIVDLGAQALADESHVYTPLIEAGLDWRCIGFEPQKDRLEDRLARERDGRLTLHAAFVGDGESRTFYRNSDSGSSSLLPLNHAFNSAFDDIGAIRTIGQETVQTATLDSLLGTQAVDFLKLDIQGFELAALTGAEHVLRHTNVVHCEVFFAPMYEASPLFSDIEAFLRARDFAFLDFSHLNRYEYVDVPNRTGHRDRLIWGDAVFFRQLKAGRDEPHCFFAQAAIASLVYNKDGLAQKLLQGSAEERKP